MKTYKLFTFFVILLITASSCKKEGEKEFNSKVKKNYLVDHIYTMQYPSQNYNDTIDKIIDIEIDSENRKIYLYLGLHTPDTFDIEHKDQSVFEFESGRVNKRLEFLNQYDSFAYSKTVDYQYSMGYIVSPKTKNIINGKLTTQELTNFNSHDSKAGKYHLEIYTYHQSSPSYIISDSSYIDTLNVEYSSNGLQIGQSNYLIPICYSKMYKYKHYYIERLTKELYLNNDSIYFHSDSIESNSHYYTQSRVIYKGHKID